MKIFGARSEPLPPTRHVQGPAAATAERTSAPGDSVAFLGVGQAELTPAVTAALQGLLAEIEELRGEVARLRARLAESEELADRDVLTPVLNRRAFLRELRRISAFVRRYGTPASLAFFDLDGFKRVNDLHGHAAGDAVLTAVAERVLAHVRESDVVGRIGGDEFAVILVQADQATAEGKARALLEVLEEATVPFPGGEVRLQISCGVRQVLPDLDPAVLLAEADRAMYAAKRARRAG